MRNVLITGATSGFGKLLVDAFLQNGDRVIASGRNLSQRSEIFIQEREKYSDRFLEVDLDVTDREQIASAFSLLESKLGVLHILINNAGYGSFGAIEDVREDEIRFQMEVNFFGTVLMTQAFIPLLRKAPSKIFNFSSVFGFMGFPLTSVYCASKYAVEGFTESLRGELAPFNIQLCLIEPGGYTTDFRKNITWSMKNSGSLYAQQIKNYQALHELASARKPQDPKEVSQGLLKLSLRKQLPMRKVFGTDGRLSYGMKRFIPSRLYYGVMDTFFKRYFQKES